ncbi:MAG: hypothetical protein KDA45_00110 [Planctomycetales bacterium]|nr:hypothetical protein [Planctomycetales bacterium]
MRWGIPTALAALLLLCSCGATESLLHAELRVGAAKVDVTPDQFPVLINGQMLPNSTDQVVTRVNARAIVLDDGGERLAIMVVDSCLMPRDLLDEAKQLASTRTQLKPERILISATHTHTAPSSFAALGTDADPNYVPLLRQRLVEALVAAEANLAPAEVGWASAPAPNFTALRRWVLRPDRVGKDPFGNPTVRASMHTASDPLNATGPTGPEDPQLTMIAFRTPAGRPLATLANFSMHYFGDRPISADYFGRFCDGLEKHMQADNPGGEDGPAAVAIMSHGCSGDIWKKDYMTKVAEMDYNIDEYSQGLLGIASGAYENIEYKADADLAMQERRLPMRYRVPDVQRLQWAEQIVAGLGDRPPTESHEIYAREQVYLHQMQSTEIVVQAIRIGDIAIASTPNETYALTGLKLKLQSPLKKTMVIELANGGDGYIPPPEQHYLGGYNTWAARSAGLEVTAEPRIVAANLQLLEQVCGEPRRAFKQSQGAAAQARLALKPLVYWRLDEMSPVPARDANASVGAAKYEPGVVFFLEGPEGFTQGEDVNRCAHFAGGRLRADLPQLAEDFTVVMSFWNGMPVDAREVAGWMFSRDYDYSTSASGLHLGLAGAGEHPGCLMLQCGSAQPAFGKTAISRWQWATVALVKRGRQLQVYLAGSKTPEIDVELSEAEWIPAQIAELFLGGRSDNESNWEGRLDEIAIYDSPLNAQQLATLLEP